MLCMSLTIFLLIWLGILSPNESITDSDLQELIISNNEIIQVYTTTPSLYLEIIEDYYEWRLTNVDYLSTNYGTR